MKNKENYKFKKTKIYPKKYKAIQRVFRNSLQT